MESAQKGSSQGEDFLFLGLSTAWLNPLPPPASRRGGMGRRVGVGTELGAAHPMSPAHHLAAGGLEGGSRRGVWLPQAPYIPFPPRLGNRRNPTARQRPRAEAARRPGGGPGSLKAARGEHRPRPTSSSSVTVFLQPCSRVVKLDVVWASCSPRWSRR